MLNYWLERKNLKIVEINRSPLECVTGKMVDTARMQLSNSHVFKSWVEDGRLWTMRIAPIGTELMDQLLFELEYEIVERKAQELFADKLKERVWETDILGTSC